jgi:hypothetical protein
MSKRLAASGVRSQFSVAVTDGANVDVVRVAGLGVVKIGVATVGANVESVSAAVDGVTVRWSLAVTAGAKVPSVSEAVSGVTS